MRGKTPIDGAIETLAGVDARKLVLTNNASRGPEEVSGDLQRLGFDIQPCDVISSAQSAARLLAEEFTPGSTVLVVGTESLVDQLHNVGLKVVRSWADNPVAVVQGHSPRTTWGDLAEATLAIRSGVPWFVTNLDLTFPSERGLVPGNGSLAAAIAAATNARPRLVGKPRPRMLEDALARGHFRAPLVVGDRLDTDIAGANIAGLPSMLVLSGVSTARDVVYCPVAHHPTYIAWDICSLGRHSAESLMVTAQKSWRIAVRGDSVEVASAGSSAGDDELSVVRALVAAPLGMGTPRPRVIHPRDAAAQVALSRVGLLE